MECVLQQTAEGKWWCPECDPDQHRLLKVEAHRNCTNAPPVIEAAERLAEETGDPSIIEKAAHYAVALVRWKRAGYPVRTDEEVKHIYETHCNPRDKPCKRFRNDTCRLCGCRVAAKGPAVRNKITMATEHCEDGKWGDDYSAAISSNPLRPS